MLALHPLHAPFDVYAKVAALLLATGMVAVGMGLAISALAGSEDQSMSFIPLALIPQLLFAGTTVPIAQLSEPLHTFSRTMFSQWSLRGVGDTLHVNSRLVTNPPYFKTSGFGSHFFNIPFGRTLLVLAIFAAVFYGSLVALLLRRRAAH